MLTPFHRNTITYALVLTGCQSAHCGWVSLIHRTVIDPLPHIHTETERHEEDREDPDQDQCDGAIIDDADAGGGNSDACESVERLMMVSRPEQRPDVSDVRHVCL